MIDRHSQDRKLNWPHYIETWLGEYEQAAKAYCQGSMSRVDALMALRGLGYKDQALDIELMVLTRRRDQWRKLRGIR